MPMSLKRMIRDRIPVTWLAVLTEHRKINMYVDLVYKTQCHKGGKTSAENTKSRIQRIKTALHESNEIGDTSSFWYSFDNVNLLTSEEREEWKIINQEIQQLKIRL